MSKTSYPECIAELYSSEVLGEALMLELLRHSTDDEPRYKWGTLLQLESETKARLRPFLAKYGMSLLEEDVSAIVENLGKVYKSSSWAEFAEKNRKIVSSFVTRFEEIEKLGPPEDAQILHSMVVHERSILKFFELELAGKPKGSLSAVIDQLHYPLPNPNNY
jgi:hypothetical protein